eukprot:Awhi_evm1s4803
MKDARCDRTPIDTVRGARGRDENDLRGAGDGSEDVVPLFLKKHGHFKLSRQLQGKVKAIHI